MKLSFMKINYVENTEIAFFWEHPVHWKNPGTILELYQISMLTVYLYVEK